MAKDATIHRALASPVRASLLEVLSGKAAPVGVSQLADELGLHTNTVRNHLAILEHAGLVTSSLRAPRERGRPRHLFRAVEQPEPDPDVAYQLLATLLAEIVSSGQPEIDQVAEDAAAEWGHRLALSDTVARTSPDGSHIDRLVGLFDALGFEPVLELEAHDDVSLTFGRCAFLEVARNHPDLACAVHKGLMRGALEALDDGGTTVELTPAPAEGRCTAYLQHAR